MCIADAMGMRLVGLKTFRVLAVTLWVWGWTSGSVCAKPTVRIADSGNALELLYPAEKGSYQDKIPIHRSGEIRYFSAGVGIEEREAVYPPFPLKVVLTAGGRPYVAGVTLTIREAKGGVVTTIPGDQIAGPWLFVDLPPGVYDVSGTMGELTERVRSFRVEKGKTKTLHLRFEGEGGQPGSQVTQ